MTEKEKGAIPFESAPQDKIELDSSTATEAQRRRIVEMLRTGAKTTLDFRRAGIMQSQTRIFELRNRLGYDIPTVGRVTITDDQGYLHDNVALYELAAEPGEVDRQRGFIAPERPPLDLVAGEVASTTPRSRKARIDTAQQRRSGDPFGDIPGAGDIDWTGA